MDAEKIKLAGKSKPRPARRADLALALAMLSKAVRIYQARQYLALVPALPPRSTEQDLDVEAMRIGLGDAR